MKKKIKSILSFAKKKKIKYLDTAEEYSNLDIKYDKDLKNLKYLKNWI